MIIINAKLQIDENKRDDYLELMNELVQNSRQEEGNVFYHHYEDVNEKNVFVVVENYKDEHAVQDITTLDISKHSVNILVTMLLKSQRLM